MKYQSFFFNSLFFNQLICNLGLKTIQFNLATAISILTFQRRKTSKKTQILVCKDCNFDQNVFFNFYCFYLSNLHALTKKTNNLAIRTVTFLVLLKFWGMEKQKAVSFSNKKGYHIQHSQMMMLLLYNLDLCYALTS